MTDRLAINPVPTDERLTGLDGMRGLAALAVFGVHFNQIAEVDTTIGPVDFYLFFANGEYGVALFFLLSGLLLSQPFWKSIFYQTTWPGLQIYFIRRLARILPAYYFSLTLLILITGYWKYSEAWPDILLHYSFLFNYTEFSFFSINAPFWTLAIEVQFYFLLPCIFLALRRLAPYQAFIMLFCMSLTAYFLHFGLVSTIDETILWPLNPVLTWIRPYGAVITHSLLAHLPHFLIGIMTGGLLLHLRTRNPTRFPVGSWVYDAIFWLSLSLLLLCLSTEATDWVQIPHGRYGLPVVSLLLGALLVSAPLSHSANRLLESILLRPVGVLSYGIYIYHLPILGLVDKTMGEYGFDAGENWIYLVLISLPLTLLAATLSYMVVERPIQRFAHRRRD